jgi:hypothetical protein
LRQSSSNFAARFPSVKQAPAQKEAASESVLKISQWRARKSAHSAGNIFRSAICAAQARERRSSMCALRHHDVTFSAKICPFVGQEICQKILAFGISIAAKMTPGGC